jgi:hypothetical protein
MAAMDLADIQRAGANAFKLRQRHRQDFPQYLDELVNGAFTQLGIGRVAHLALAPEGSAKCALRCQGKAIVGGLTVDQEAAALGSLVGNQGSSRVALFA